MALPRNPMAITMRRFHSPIYKMRLRGIRQHILPWLRAGNRVLDVGCSFGALGRMIMESPLCPAGVKVAGLEKIRQDDAQIPIEYYSGVKIPYPDNAFDVVILADVLHHETDPHRLIGECARVAKRYLIIKDHKLDGFSPRFRISLMDWLFNIAYGVPCLYHYNKIQEWHRWYTRHGLVPVFEKTDVALYPKIINSFLGGCIQYFVVLRSRAAISPGGKYFFKHNKSRR